VGCWDDERRGRCDLRLDEMMVENDEMVDDEMVDVILGWMR